MPKQPISCIQRKQSLLESVAALLAQNGKMGRRSGDVTGRSKVRVGKKEVESHLVRGLYVCTCAQTYRPILYHRTIPSNPVVKSHSRVWDFHVPDDERTTHDKKMLIFIFRFCLSSRKSRRNNFEGFRRQKLISWTTTKEWAQDEVLVGWKSHGTATTNDVV